VKKELKVDPGEVIYREATGFSTLAVFVMLLTAVMLYVFVVSLVKGNTGGAVFFGVVTAILVALYVNFRKLEFEITENLVVVRFGLIVTRIQRPEIRSCEPYELTFRNYLGYGIRYGLDGTKAYNVRNGRGIKMVIDGEKRPLVVSVDAPETACRLLSPERPPGS